MRLLTNFVLSGLAVNAAVSVVGVTCGPGSVYNLSPQTIPSLTEGDTLVFSFTDSSCQTGGTAPHPFLIQTSGGTSLSNSLVMNQGGTTGNITWVTKANDAGNYKYQCQIHAAMTGTFTVYAPTRADYPTNLVASPLSGSSLNLKWDAGASWGDCMFTNWNVQYYNGGVGTPAGCTNLTNMGVTSCNVTGLDTTTEYSFTVSAACTISTADSYDSSSSSNVYLATAVLGPVNYGLVTADSALIQWNTANNVEYSGCNFQGYLVQTVKPVAGQNVTGCEFDSLYYPSSGYQYCTATGLTPNTAYEFRVQALCSNPTWNSAAVNSTSVTTGNEINVSVACAFSGANYYINGVSNAAIHIPKAGDTLFLNFNDTSCDSNTNAVDNWYLYIETTTGGSADHVTNDGETTGTIRLDTDVTTPASLQYVCSSPTPCSTAMGTITIDSGAGLAAADAPPTVTAAAIAGDSTSLEVSWTAGAQNGCVFSGWLVTVSGYPVAGCLNLNTLTTTKCNATGLTAATGYYVYVTEICTMSALNSPDTYSNYATTSGSSVVSANSPSVDATVASSSSVTVSWTAGTQYDCVFSSWQVTFYGGGAVTGCSNLNNYSATTCTATGLTAGASYQFAVMEVCTDVNANSGKGYSYTVCPGSGTTSSTAAASPYNVMATQVAGLTDLTVTWDAGTQNDCQFSSWVVTFYSGGTGAVMGCQSLNTYATQTCTATGLTASTSYQFSVMEVCTNTSLNSGSDYSSSVTTNGAGGIMPAAAPSSVVATQIEGVTDLALNWVAGAQNNCTFSSWSVTFKAGGAVTGCTNLTKMSATNCTATNLSATTAYQFSVKEVCSNATANSATTTSTSVTTISLDGIKICQGAGTCNCGNATICTCQLTTTCNCENAQKCICQGGVCNGGNAGTLICNFPTNCNKQCAQSCPICISTITDGLFGGSSCKSSSMMLKASGALVALLAFLIA